MEGQIKTEVYQAQLLHKEFAQALNVVILSKTHQITLKRSQVILFSSDLELDYKKLIDYYSLRFQIEFNFRDAKQFWGLEDFMKKARKSGDECRQSFIFYGQLISKSPLFGPPGAGSKRTGS